MSYDLEVMRLSLENNLLQNNIRLYIIDPSLESRMARVLCIGYPF